MNTNSLSPLQLELLKAFARPSVDETDLREIRKMLSQYFAKKASIEAQKLVEQRQLSAEEVEAIAHEHNRMAYSA
jgi:hypothetical protein